MKIFGIHDGHNASLSFLEDGIIKFAIQEERYTYEKNQGGIPYRSIDYARDKFSINDDDVVGFVGTHLPTHDWTDEKQGKAERIQSHLEFQYQPN